MQRNVPGMERSDRSKSTSRVVLIACALAALLPVSQVDAEDKIAGDEQLSREEAGAGGDVLLFPAHPGLVIVPASVSQYTDLRVQTDRVRERSPGEIEQVYEMEHPRDGAVFLEFELHVSNDGDPWSVRPVEVRLVQMDPSKKNVPLRDLATESARIPLETEAVLLAGKQILYLRFEPDLEGINDLTLWIEDAELGSVAELRALAGPDEIKTEAGASEHDDHSH